MWSRRRTVVLVIAAAILLLLIGGRMLAEFMVELLWYRSLDHERVFWTLWGARVGVRLAIALPLGIFVFLNLWFVSRSLGAIRVRRRFGNIEIAEKLPQAYVYTAAGIIAVLSGWWLSATTVDPLGVLAAFRAEPWGVPDPIHGWDASFYVFRYPVLHGFQTLAGLVIFWCALLVTASYAAISSIRFVDGNFHITPAARRHLGLLAAAFLLVLAWSYWLDRYAIVISGQGVGQAIGYADAHARLPGKIVASVLALLAAGAVARGTWQGTRRLPIIGIIALVLGVIGTHHIYPALIQKLVVEPNEYPREQPYIENHLNFTRSAFGLAQLRREPLPYRPPVDLDPARALERLEGVPLWDERPLLQAFAQRQSLFPYYDFTSVHTDRYGPRGEVEQVAISVRELEVSRLSETAQTWQNLHLQYVASQGVVVSPVAEMTDDASPILYVSDLNPTRVAAAAPEALRLEEPSIYFAERTRGYVLIDEPGGPIGVPLDAVWKKLGFAWAFQSRNLLLSSEVTRDSRIVYARQVIDRARAVAPFLHFSDQAGKLPVIDEGRVKWMVEGYTMSTSFPLARALAFDGRPVRYLRNSAKVIVDGVTGAVQIYASNPDDPMLRTYARIFPGLVRPLEEMPPSMQTHLRVPPALMEAQSRLLEEYHLPDARNFYTKDDVWTIATENYGNESIPVRPTYVMLPLPGEEVPEFLATVPFVARGRQNMTAMYVVRNDPPHYGERILYELRRDEQIPGPQQIEAMIDQDPEISQQLALWRQSGSNVVRGHLVVVPFDSTTLYVEPLFLVAQNQAIPQLERVIVSNGRRVVMRPTLAAAVTSLLGGEADEGNGRTPVVEPDGSGAAETPTSTVDVAAIARARRLMEQADAQLRAGDLAGFGRTWELLREALRDGTASLPEPR